ncbi:MAG: hypothetical protein GF421_09375 [Candidatus Aminicenantes bacterium]|nr:hypothetical protein [Candidatus Aminicenantes bacterium]
MCGTGVCQGCGAQKVRGPSCVFARNKVTKPFKYWLPPLLWMGFLFPLWNRFLSSPFLYRWNIRFWLWLNQDMSRHTIGLYYIYLRRSLHVVAYGLMAYLVYRFFWSGKNQLWKLSWAVYTALITIGYGVLDEFLQSYLKPRQSSLMDIVMDAIGAVVVLGVIYLRSVQRKKSEKGRGE